jgi:hypothetical protein
MNARGRRSTEWTAREYLCGNERYREHFVDYLASCHFPSIWQGERWLYFHVLHNILLQDLIYACKTIH